MLRLIVNCWFRIAYMIMYGWAFMKFQPAWCLYQCMVSPATIWNVSRAFNIFLYLYWVWLSSLLSRSLALFSIEIYIERKHVGECTVCTLLIYLHAAAATTSQRISSLGIICNATHIDIKTPTTTTKKAFERISFICISIPRFIGRTTCWSIAIHSIHRHTLSLSLSWSKPINISGYYFGFYLIFLRNRIRMLYFISS